MPLFNTLENELSAFFVSQGSIFDSILRTVFERISHVESRVEHNAKNVNKLLRELNARPTTSSTPAPVTVSSAPVDSNAELEYYVMTVSRQLNVVLALLFQPFTQDPVASVHAQQQQMQSISDVLTDNEWILMNQAALSAAEMASSVFAAPAQKGVSAPALADLNDSIASQEGTKVVVHSVAVSDESLPTSARDSEPGTSSGTTDAPTLHQSELAPIDHNAVSVSENEATTITPVCQSDPNESLTSGAPSFENLVGICDPTSVSIPTISRPEDGEPGGTVVNAVSVNGDETTNLALSQSPVEAPPSTPSDRETQDTQTELRPRGPASSSLLTELFESKDDVSEADTITHSSSYSSSGPTARTRKQSTFEMVHSLHHADTLRRQQEADMLRFLRDLMRRTQAQAKHHADVDALRAQQEAMLRELQMQNAKLRAELEYQQKQQASAEMSHAQLQSEMDKQLLAFSNAMLAAQTAQEQQIAQILDNLRGLVDQFVATSEVPTLEANWLQAARDHCIYGLNPQSLEVLQQHLVELKRSPRLSQLLTTKVGQAEQLLTRVRSCVDQSPSGLHHPEASRLMHSLQPLLIQLEEELAASVAAEEGGSFTSNRSGSTDDEEQYRRRHQVTSALLTSMTGNMELGTASLLNALQSQHENFQCALLQQNADVEALQRELQEQQRALREQQRAFQEQQRVLREQQLAEQELRRQLALCPSQEETLRIINALKEQVMTQTAIEASASDSAANLLGSLDDLRARLAGLPSMDLLDELLHSKVDRSEIERLRLMLTAVVPPNPSRPSLSKSVTRCLSCDQSLVPHSTSHSPSRPSSAAVSPSKHGHHITHGLGHGDRAWPSTASTGRGVWQSSNTDASTINKLPQHEHSPSNHAFIPRILPEEEDPEQHHDIKTYQRAVRMPISLSTQENDTENVGTLPISTKQILRDLAESIEATRRRKQRRYEYNPSLDGLGAEDLLSPLGRYPIGATHSPAVSPRTSRRRSLLTFVNPVEDRKNRIPLRRPPLSDQVVYGPSITSGFLKPKRAKAALHSAHESVNEYGRQSWSYYYEAMGGTGLTGKITLLTTSLLLTT